MFPNLEFVKTALNGIVDRFMRVEQYYHGVKNEVTDVKNNKIDKKQSAVNAGKFLAIGVDGVVKPDDVVVPERHVVLLSYDSSTKKYTVNQSYSTMKQWVDAGDTVVLSFTGKIYNLCEDIAGNRLSFVYVISYTNTEIRMHTASVYTSDSVKVAFLAGYLMPNNNDQRNKGLIPVATRNYNYELTDLSNAVIKSSTEGSTKKFKLSVDDNGTISATEVTA